jgi:pyridoxal phosphate enzyme (YggS family)
MTDSIQANLRRVQGQIALAAERAGRDPASVTLIAVTKTQSPAAIQAAYEAGARTFGENRVQEAQSKIPTLTLPGAQWEMIGSLQRNKVPAASALFGRVQSVESLALAEALERSAARHDRIMPILLQVNVAGEATKHGLAPADVLPLARVISRMPHLRGEGLMTVAPLAADPASVRPVFRRLRELRDQLLAEVGPTWTALSMGMTDDFAVAISEGATLVRLGRAIFGERDA